MAHWLVAKTAREMAEQLYEEMASDQTTGNAFRARHPDMKAWVQWVHGSLLQQAREALAGILGNQSLAISEEMRDKIADALIKDASLRRTKDNRVVKFN